MLVHLVARPLTDHAHVPRSAIHELADGLRRVGVTVHEDLTALPSGDLGAAVAACADELRAAWRDQHPDVVHTVGLVATMAAVSLGAPALHVATFDERPEDPDLERVLAERVDAVLPLSGAEHARWRRVEGVRSLTTGSFPWAVPVPDEDACVQAAGHVVAIPDDDLLHTLVESMPMWGPSTLVILGRLAPERLAAITQSAEDLGVQHRLSYRPALRGRDRQDVWSDAALLVAGPGGSRHGGMVLEAAAHGVPALAVGEGAHLDHVVPGSTGQLVATNPSARLLGQVASAMLEDSFALRAMGTAALVRVRTMHDPSTSGRRLLVLYDAVRPAVERVSTVQAIGLDRQALALEHLALARQLAGWYAGRGQSREDLVQVASLGLVRAASRFDPTMGKEFHSFAIPTILGELRKHFRDHAWALRVPRSLQETSLQVQRSSQQLRQSLGHEASATEVAAELGLVEEEVLEALRVDGEARSSHSLDHPMGEDESVGDLVGAVDPALDLVELRWAVRAALRQLPEREQQILLMRFYGERTQSEIAERLGISQVHVSRVLARTLAALRDHVLYDLPLPRAWQAGPVGAEPAHAAPDRPAPAPSIPRPRQAS